MQGDGFFVVQNAGDQTFFTRAGSFVPVQGSGYLENAAGMRLMGYPITGGVTPPIVINGIGGLEQIQLSALALAVYAVNQRQFFCEPADQQFTTGTANPSVLVAANRPSANLNSATPTVGPTSMTVYDNVGNKVTLDVYATRITPAVPPAGVSDQWEITVFNAANRAATGTDAFPYTAAAAVDGHVQLRCAGPASGADQHAGRYR